MPKVAISRTWTEDDDTDLLRVTVDVEQDYPQTLDQAKRVALETFAQAHYIVLIADKDDIDEPSGDGD